MLMGLVQRGLEGDRRHRAQRAAKMQQMLQQRYEGIAVLNIPAEVAEVQAVLVVMADEELPDRHKAFDCHDEEWIRPWWEQLVCALEPLDKVMGNAVGSSASGARRRVPIDLDTPPYGPLSEEEQQQREYEAAKIEEEKEILAMVEAFEREEEARLHREREQREFQDELQRPTKSQRRLQLNITVNAEGSSTSSRTHLPMEMTDPRPTTITLTMNVVEHALPAPDTELEEDTTVLMQTNRQGSGTCQQRLQHFCTGYILR